jgi:acyl carrier protein
MPTQPEPLSFEQFQKLVGGILQLPPELVQPQADFVTDLGVDSLRMAEVLLRLEALGLPLSFDLTWRIRTVADAYRYYQEQAGA